MLAVQLLAVGAVPSSSEPTSLQDLTPIERRIYQNHQQGSTAQDRATSPLPADPNRVVITIPPSDTDPKIDKYVKDHYVMFNHAVRPNEKLFLWLPGSYGRPIDNQYILDLAASNGYRAIGLEYYNIPPVISICVEVPDIACSTRVREERLTGTDTSPEVDVSTADSILNRFTKLLVYLQTHYPKDGWHQFLQDGKPNWSKIVLGGHSQGSGMAAFMAKRFAVARVVLFSGPADYSRPAHQLADWLRQPSATPPECWYGLYHAKEKAARAFNLAYSLLGLLPSHIRVVELAPRTNEVLSDDPYHGSVIGDRVTPLDANGRPAYREVWSFLIGR